MRVDEQRIVNAVEFDRVADRRFDHARTAQHGGRMPADAIEPIESPNLLAVAPRALATSRRSRGGGGHAVRRAERRPD